MGFNAMTIMFCKSTLTSKLGTFSNKTLLTHKRFLQAPKRFYKDVSISQTNGIFEINLDNRKLKTPMGKVFQVPSEGLAVAVAAEWNAQEKIIRLASMHLTSLCNTALDNPFHKTKESLTDGILEFLPTDTICYSQDDPPELAELQANEWQPVVQWFCKRFDVDIKRTSTMDGPTISNRTKDNIGRHILSYDFWSIVGINSAVDSLKSVILTMSVVDCYLSVEKAVFLSRLELEFQIARWGSVEWAHDIELMDLRARVAAAVMFVHFNRQSSVKRLRSSKVNSTAINMV